MKLGSQPLPPYTNGVLVLRADGVIDEAAPGLPSKDVKRALAAMRKKRASGWVVGYWKTPRGQIWLEKPVTTVGSGDFEDAKRALLYRCGVV